MARSLIGLDEDDDDRGLRVRQAMLMSIAPEAFEWLRHETYAHARTCGDAARQFEPLRAWCAARLATWVSSHPERAEMPTGQLQATAAGVARYVAENYRPHRRRAAPRRTRDHRAADELLITDFRDVTRKPSVRNVAAVAEMSKSKAGRLLARQGFAPGRAAKATTLKPTVRRVLDVVEQALGREGDRSFGLDDLAEQLWPRTTHDALRRQHRKRVRDALREIAAAGLGFHAELSTTHAVIRRGRRWKPGEGAAALADASSRPLRPLHMVLADPAVGGPFWSSPEIRSIVMALRVASGERPPFQDLHFYIRAHADIRMIDTSPLARLLLRAFDPCNGDDFAVEQMWRDSARLRREDDPVRKQLGSDLHHMSNTFILLREDGRWGRCAYDCLGTVLRELGTRRGADLAGQQRIDHLRTIFDQLWHDDPEADVKAALALCKRLAEQEAKGHWQAPDYSDAPC